MAETEQERAERYAAIEAQAKTMTASRYNRRQFLSAATGAVAAVAGFRAFRGLQSQEQAANIPKFLRRGHELNEDLWRALFREDKLAPTFARSASSPMRINGLRGMDGPASVNSWQLRVEGPDGTVLGRHDIEEIQALPKTEMTVEHKCVEGWSHKVTWGGTPFSNFWELYADQFDEQPRYVALWTPDQQYFVGMDMPSMMHSQTMLTWEIEGEPLSEDHGAPLRLSTPLKYGIKQIKRIGTVAFTNEQPEDFWYDRGYDFYSHL